MPRLLSPALFALLFAACGPPAPDDPGAVVIDDDDDSAGDDDDSTVGDDDDSTEAGDLQAWAVLVEQETLGSGSASLGFDAFALASFGSGDPLPFGDPDVDGFLLPGAGLHPEQMAAGEGCDVLSSDDALDPLPATDPVGGVVPFTPSAAAPVLSLEATGGVYSWEAAEALDADTYSIGVKGGADWPPASFDDVLQLPAAPTGFIQGPGGSISNLATIEFRYTQGDDPGGIEVTMFRWTTANQTSWAAVRCRGVDDGSIFMDASSLSMGSGDIAVTVSRARWVTAGVQAGGRAVHPHLGAVRSVTYALTPVGR